MVPVTQALVLMAVCVSLTHMVWEELAIAVPALCLTQDPHVA